MPWSWTDEKYTAATLLARGKTRRQAADRSGVTARTIGAWSQRPEFHEELLKQQREFRGKIIADEIGDAQHRVWRLRDRVLRMDAVIAERATDEHIQHVAGAKSGLIVRTKAGQFGDVYAVDKGLLDQLRSHEEQIARELGQWDKDEKIDRRVMIVVPIAQAPQAKGPIELPPDEPPMQLPGVVIDSL